MKGAVDTQLSDSTPERHWVYIIVACLSLVGLADAIYLTIEHITGRSVQCTIIAGCSEVLSSSYAVISGIPVAMIGAVAYLPSSVSRSSISLATSSPNSCYWF